MRVDRFRRKRLLKIAENAEDEEQVSASKLDVDAADQRRGSENSKEVWSGHMRAISFCDVSQGLRAQMRARNAPFAYLREQEQKGEEDAMVKIARKKEKVERWTRDVEPGLDAVDEDTFNSP